MEMMIGPWRAEAFILICTALVSLMTPGLAFFYGGLVKDTSVSWLERGDFAGVPIADPQIDGLTTLDVYLYPLLFFFGVCWDFLMFSQLIYHVLRNFLSQLLHKLSLQGIDDDDAMLYLYGCFEHLLAAWPL